MALLDQLTQGNPIAGLLAQRRQQGGAPQQPPRFQSVGEMVPQANLQPIGPQEGPGGGLMPLPDGATQQQQQEGGGTPGRTGLLVAPGALPSQDSGVTGFLEGLLTGPQDEALSEGDNRSAVRDGLKAAGITGLAALTAGAAPLALPLIGALAGRSVANARRKEAHVAQNAALEAAEVAARKARMEAIGETLNPAEETDLTIQDVDRAIALAAAGGETELLGHLVDIRESFPEPPKEEYYKPEAVNLADGTMAVFDPNERGFFAPNGEPLMELPERVAQREDRLQYVTGEDPATGRPVAGVTNLSKGTFTPISGVIPSGSMTSEKIGPEAIQLAEAATIGRNSLGVIERYLDRRVQEGGDNPLRGLRLDRERFEKNGVVSVILSQRDKIDNETQEFLQALESFMLVESNRIAGVRGISNDEARNVVYRTFGFEEGDSLGNIHNTLNELQIKVRSLELQAGGSLSLLEEYRLFPDEQEQEEEAEEKEFDLDAIFSNLGGR